MKKGVEATGLLRASDPMLGESMFLCLSLFIGEMGYYPPQRCSEIEMVISESVYGLQAPGMLASLVSSVCGIIYLISFYFWSFTYPFCFVLLFLLH